jgi:hypothetical protein
MGWQMLRSGQVVATHAVGVQTRAAQLPKQRGNLRSHVNNHCTHAYEFLGRGHFAHRAMLFVFFLMDAMPEQTSYSTPCHSRCVTCYLLMRSRVAPSSCWTVCCSLLERSTSGRTDSGYKALVKFFPASVPELNGMFDGNLLKVPVQDVPTGQAHSSSS